MCCSDFDIKNALYGSSDCLMLPAFLKKRIQACVIAMLCHSFQYFDQFLQILVQVLHNLKPPEPHTFLFSAVCVDIRQVHKLVIKDPH